MNLTFDLWPLSLEAKWTFVQILKKFPQSSPDSFIPENRLNENEVKAQAETDDGSVWSHLGPQHRK